jgi:hypothetical protein
MKTIQMKKKLIKDHLLANQEVQLDTTVEKKRKKLTLT